MKKIIIVFLGIILAGFLYFFAFQESITITVIKPFDHPLFVTQEDLLSTGFEQYHFIENNIKGANLSVHSSAIQPKEKIEDPSDLVFITVHQLKNVVEASKFLDFFIETYLNRLIGVGLTENFNNIGQRNILIEGQEDDENEYIATLVVLENNYLIEIESNSVESFDKAKEQVEVFARLMLEKVKNN